MSTRYNEKFIALMGELATIMLKHGETFRARAYKKAQETIISYSDDITSPLQLKGQPGIGSTILEKMKEYVLTGTLKVLEREKTNPINILTNIYGIGPKKAQELVEKGIKTVEHLRQVQDIYLNDNQKVGLKYYEDILKRIPRGEIEDYKAVFQKTFNEAKTMDGDMFEIVGSYRRGQLTSGDIDVIITCKNKKTFVAFIDSLIQQKVIVDVLSRGLTKCLVVAKIALSGVYRRVDLLYSPPEEYPFAILYFTGSKEFNTGMRHQALTMGLTMNEHGLYKMNEKKKGEKVDAVFHTEKDIFGYLQMEYKRPEKR